MSRCSCRAKTPALTGERFKESITLIADEAHCDFSARGFWSAGQVAFLDIRVFNRYANQSLSKSYEIKEKQKKRAYNQRVQKVQHDTFTSLVMSATGGIGRTCKKLYSRLSVSDKRNQPFSIVVAWIRRKVLFSLLKNIDMCIRGSREVEQ